MLGSLGTAALSTQTSRRKGPEAADCPSSWISEWGQHRASPLREIRHTEALVPRTTEGSHVRGRASENLWYLFACFTGVFAW